MRMGKELIELGKRGFLAIDIKVAQVVLGVRGGQFDKSCENNIIHLHRYNAV